jgi:hypothetical protein
LISRHGLVPLLIEGAEKLKALILMRRTHISALLRESSKKARLLKHLLCHELEQKRSEIGDAASLIRRSQ